MSCCLCGHTKNMTNHSYNYKSLNCLWNQKCDLQCKIQFVMKNNGSSSHCAPYHFHLSLCVTQRQVLQWELMCGSALTMLSTVQYLSDTHACLFFPLWCCLSVSAAHSSGVCQSAGFHSKFSLHSVYFWLKHHSLSLRGCNSCQTAIVRLWITIGCRLSPLSWMQFIY